MADEYDHKCSDRECPSFGQCTRWSSCLCHKTREQMMLAALENQGKPFYTYPEDREKLLSLARKVESQYPDATAAACELADLVKGILEDEAVALA